ncbi:MAG TPA: hypothetical protein VIL65_01400 [Beijerinckiaceae bacterium]|jgi:hypothetical protein
MAGGQALSPDEIVVLLDPTGGKGREALKGAMLALIAQDVLRIKTSAQRRGTLS